MKSLLAESDFWERHSEFTDRYHQVIVAAYSDARALLPLIVEEVTFVSYIAPWDCLSDYGLGGFTKSSRMILLSIDDALPLGETRLLTHVRETVFHELNHSSRYEQGINHSKFIDNCIMEGLATTFEKIYAHSKPPYGDYPVGESASWVGEIVELGETINTANYMFTHPDGRRFIGYKVGTYIIEQAMQMSRKSILELTSLSCDEILMLARIKRAKEE